MKPKAPLEPDRDHGSGGDLPLFDRDESERQRDIGMAKAAASRDDVLRRAREIAIVLAAARPDGITSDDVTRALVREGYTPDDLGSAAGSVFKTKDFRWTGRVSTSSRVARHGGIQRIWELA
jgi:hypothetical protein